MLSKHKLKKRARIEVDCESPSESSECKSYSNLWESLVPNFEQIINDDLSDVEQVRFAYTLIGRELELEPRSNRQFAGGLLRNSGTGFVYMAEKISGKNPAFEKNANTEICCYFAQLLVVNVFKISYNTIAVQDAITNEPQSAFVALQQQECKKHALVDLAVKLFHGGQTRRLDSVHTLVECLSSIWADGTAVQSDGSVRLAKLLEQLLREWDRTALQVQPIDPVEKSGDLFRALLLQRTLLLHFTTVLELWNWRSVRDEYGKQQT
ncbi:uncharacterized protein DEA37_0003454 [Paragonimus westermani]|uniref:Uncharacterized protein n=1 Tax=Paragonimus westermani TaxID=34504 RepID=A0A5J4NR12_9TREM|nr:uncharacterized protein DEA37_0003454 [Paragonimus westermani]